jgi:hypothetical protein
VRELAGRSFSIGDLLLSIEETGDAEALVVLRMGFCSGNEEGRP